MLQKPIRIMSIGNVAIKPGIAAAGRRAGSFGIMLRAFASWPRGRPAPSGTAYNNLMATWKGLELSTSDVTVLS